MGYYTKFELHVKHIGDFMEVDPETEAKMAKTLWDNYIMGYPCVYSPKTLESVFDDTMKWYSHEHDMIEFSKEYPDYVFLLIGIGEKADDQWRLYVYNGEAERIYAKIVYDPPQNSLFWCHVD